MSKRLPPRLVRRRKRLLWGAFFLLAVGGAGWSVFLSPFFLIRNISVNAEGPTTIPHNKIEEALSALRDESPHIVSFSPESWEHRLRERFPELAAVNVNRSLVRFPPLKKEDWFVNEVEVKIAERQALGVTCRERCYFFDRDGILFREFGGTPATPFIADKRNVGYALRYQVFSPETVEKLTSLFSRSPSADVFTEHLEVTDYETTLVMDEGWRLILANARPVEEQIEVARRVLEKEIGPRRAGLEYLDATVKNRVYYRYRAAQQ